MNVALDLAFVAATVSTVYLSKCLYCLWQLRRVRE